MAIEVKNNDPVAAIQGLLRSMLEKGLVSAIMAPQEIPSKKTVVQTLVRDPSKLESVNPLAPVFGVNSARIVAKMCVALMTSSASGPDAVEEPQQDQADESEQTETETEVDDSAETQQEQSSEDKQSGSDEVSPEAESEPTAKEQSAPVEEESSTPPIALVLRPCEIRAIVELVKLQQVNLSPFVIIGVDCWGTYSVKDYAAKVDESSEASSVTADFLKQSASGDIPEGLRNACSLCQFPAPTYSDIVIRLIGEDISKQLGLGAGTQKGKEMLGALGLEATDQSQKRKDALEKLKEARKKLIEQNKVDFLEIISSLCINCRNCREVCPICYCKQCVFDGEVFKYPLEKYLTWSGKKGVLPMPSDKLLFHLTRMSHVATSCVACGQCEAACPNGIPLGRIYQQISSAAQEALGYKAGESLDDELPLTTFREDELSVVEN